MAKNTSVSLGDHFTSFIDERVAEGTLQLGQRGGSGGAAAARRARGESSAALRAAVAEGEASGEARPFDFETFLASKLAGRG
jgi:antitoxin ParD1/3/4